MKLNKKKIALVTLFVFLLGSISLVGCAPKPAVEGTAPAVEKTASSDYPSRPVTMLIPHKAGSSTDIMARALQPYLQKYLGEKASVVIENEGGGGGNAAHVKTYKAAPDGYTIEMSAFPSVTLGELVKGGEFKALEYTYLHTVTGGDYNGIFVKYDSPYNDIKSLVEAAKTKKITMSGSGIGTNGHMAMKLLEKSSGTIFEYVSYDGGTEAAVAVAGGHTVSGVGNIVSLKQMVDEKKIKILAVIGANRHPNYPDVPTAVEAGYTDAAMDVCVGVYAPPSLPADIAKALEDALSKAVNDPEFKAQAEKLGSSIVPLGSAEFKKLAENIYNQANMVKDDLKETTK
ncbi:MAG TPA: tripartite tricarboxylate transporter substrate binding protein [Clostridia bacterium]|nr:tripartite tricarboxylate transporter substrate binding protein [Clostridia bacterium]